MKLNDLIHAKERKYYDKSILEPKPVLDFDKLLDIVFMRYIGSGKDTFVELIETEKSLQSANILRISFDETQDYDTLELLVDEDNTVFGSTIVEDLLEDFDFEYVDSNKNSVHILLKRLPDSGQDSEQDSEQENN